MAIWWQEVSPEYFNSIKPLQSLVCLLFPVLGLLLETNWMGYTFWTQMWLPGLSTGIQMVSSLNLRTYRRH